MTKRALGTPFQSFLQPLATDGHEADLPEQESEQAAATVI
jgi:hypothetical protein